MTAFREQKRYEQHHSNLQRCYPWEHLNINPCDNRSKSDIYKIHPKVVQREEEQATVWGNWSIMIIRLTNWQLKFPTNLNKEIKNAVYPTTTVFKLVKVENFSTWKYILCFQITLIIASIFRTSGSNFVCSVKTETETGPCSS